MNEDYINEINSIHDMYIKQLQEKDNIINNLQSKIDKANEMLQLLHYKFKDEDTIHNEIEDIQKVLKENK